MKHWCFVVQNKSYLQKKTLSKLHTVHRAYLHWWRKKSEHSSLSGMLYSWLRCWNWYMSISFTFSGTHSASSIHIWNHWEVERQQKLVDQKFWQWNKFCNWLTKSREIKANPWLVPEQHWDWAWGLCLFWNAVDFAVLCCSKSLTKATYAWQEKKLLQHFWLDYKL